MLDPATEDSDDPVERATRRLGEVLADKWKLRRVLGVGGMAAVYEAEHRNQSRVAIKMLHAELSRDANVTRRFRQEGYAGNSIQHPGVLRVLDDNIAEDGSAFLVMDLLLGNSFEDILLTHSRLEAVLVAELADQVLDILEAAHAHGVIHRDVKPDNIFVTATGDIKLLDFGIASVRQSHRATTMGSFMGTPAFCPPEQARGRWSEVDQRSDLWALGATIFTALTGHAVHEGETITEVLALAVQARAPKVQALAPDIHPALAAVVDRALEYDKADRFQNAQEFRDALQALEPLLAPSNQQLEDLVDTSTISESSGTLLRRQKRAFRTPRVDRPRISGETRVGLGLSHSPTGRISHEQVARIAADSSASSDHRGSEHQSTGPRTSTTPPAFGRRTTINHRSGIDSGVSSSPPTVVTQRRARSRTRQTVALLLFAGVAACVAAAIALHSTSEPVALTQEELHPKQQADAAAAQQDAAAARQGAQAPTDQPLEEAQPTSQSASDQEETGAATPPAGTDRHDLGPRRIPPTAAAPTEAATSAATPTAPHRAQPAAAQPTAAQRSAGPSKTAPPVQAPLNRGPEQTSGPTAEPAQPPNTSSDASTPTRNDVLNHRH